MRGSKVLPQLAETPSYEPRSSRHERRRDLSISGIFALGLLLPGVASAAYTSPAEGSQLAVATDNADATRAALSVMDAGGNAFDGAIAAALVLGVVNPVSSGIGGGGFALFYSAKERKTVCLDFREVAPEGIDPKALFEEKKRGAMVGVPGEPAGLAWLQSHYGTRTLAEDAAAAVSLAERGFLASPYMAHAAERDREMLATSPTLASRWLPGGQPVATGAWLRDVPLAKTLAKFGAEGPAAFYQGSVANQLVAAAQGAGGRLTLGDLASYRVVERQPLSRQVDNLTVVTMPAPSAGGLMVLEAAQMFGLGTRSELAPLGFGSSAYLHMVAEAMRGAIADRIRLTADPDKVTTVTPSYDKALDAGTLKARKKSIDPKKVHPVAAFKTAEAGTTHIIVADRLGNVVAMTTTVNNAFGSHIVAGDTGILLNDQMNDFTNPNDVRGFSGPVARNHPAPGARPASSMVPTLVFENGLPILAAGGSGGPRIATEVTQAVLCRLVFALDPATCVGAPRVHVRADTPELFIEPEVPDDVRHGLKAHGENPKEEKVVSAAVQMVVWDRSHPVPTIYAASDPRKLGFAVAR